MTRAGRRGGPATAGGIDFQARFVAWAVCCLLAEREATPPWNWAQDTYFREIYAETDQPTDDVLIINSAGARAFVQAKQRVQQSKSATSPLGKAVAQFVKQWRQSAPQMGADDRLVLAIGPTSSAVIKDDLRRVLDRVRALLPNQQLADAAVNKTEHDVLKVLTDHIEREWTADAGAKPTSSEIQELLEALWVSVYELDDGGATHREAEGLLRTSILREPAQAGFVLKTLISDGVGFSAKQVGVDRAKLHAEFRRLVIDLKVVSSYQADVDKLVAYSSVTIGQLKRFESIVGPEGPVTLQRDAPSALLTEADLHSVVVTGEPGAGKSAAVNATARQAAGRGRDVVVLAADTLAAGSIGTLRDELGLEHEVVDVLQNWPGIQPGLLVVDALDAARGEQTQQALLDLIGIVSETVPRWHVVVSIRRFDLRYSSRLRAIFASAVAAPASYQSLEFEGLAHFNVPPLSDQEFGQLAALVPDLHAVLTAAEPALRELARTPFNLSLLAELVASGVTSAELTPITTQVQLLDKYWERRVIQAAGGDARESLLRGLCEAMIDARTLTIERSVAQELEGSGVPLTQLLSNRVLAEEETELGVRREVLAFGHHVLFDYAVARLILEAKATAALDRACDKPELLLLVRPSYDLYFRRLWARGPKSKGVLGGCSSDGTEREFAGDRSDTRSRRRSGTDP